MPTDYDGWGGRAYRGGLIVCTQVGFSGSLNGFTTDRPINGDKSNNGSGSWFFNSVADVGSTPCQLIFDFKAAVVIDEFKWFQDVAATQGFWNWEGSNDGSSWTTIQANFLLGHATNNPSVHSFPNSTAYRYYRLLGVSGGTNTGPWEQETEFQTDHGDFEALDRTGVGSVTISGLSLAGGSANNLINGALTNDDSNTVRFTSGQTVSGSCTIEVDFGGTVNLRAAAIMCLDGFGNNGTWQGQAFVSGSWQNFGGQNLLKAWLSAPSDGTHVWTDTPVNATKFRLLGVSGTTEDDVRLNDFFFMTTGSGAPQPEVNVSATLEVGFEVEANVVAEARVDLSASMSLGFDMDAVLTFDKLLSSSMEIGFEIGAASPEEPNPATVQSIIIVSGR